MLKDIKSFEHEIEGKVGRFLVEYDTPISVAKEMLFQFLKLLGQMEDNYKAQQAAQATSVQSQEIQTSEPPGGQNNVESNQS